MNLDALRGALRTDESIVYILAACAFCLLCLLIETIGLRRRALANKKLFNTASTKSDYEGA